MMEGDVSRVEVGAERAKKASLAGSFALALVEAANPYVKKP
jgi:hypothetical protein